MLLSGNNPLVCFLAVGKGLPWLAPAGGMPTRLHSAVGAGVRFLVGAEVVHGCSVEILGDSQSPGDAADPSVGLGGMGLL